MNTSFQQLQREDEKFQEYLRRGHGIFEEFFEFVRQETIERGNVRKRTDKLRSYFVFLIRLIYAYELYYAIDSDKKEMLQALFKKRKQAYEDKGISITLQELYKHYGM